MDQPEHHIFSNWRGELNQTLHQSRSLCMAVFSTSSKRLIFANIAALSLMKTASAESLINPKLDHFLQCDRSKQPVFNGLLTLGDSLSSNTTITASVYIKEEELLVIGEIDIVSMLEQNNKMTRLNQEINNLQRQLVKEKMLVEQTLDELKAANHKLAVLNQEKNRFLGIAAHDLRSPVSTALSYVDILKNDTDVFSEQQKEKFLLTIDERLQFSLRLMGELLDVSKIEKGFIKLNKQINDYLSILMQCIAFNQLVGKLKNIRIETECTEKEIVFSFDRNKMEQVLNNVISNAIKYSHPGSDIRIKVNRLEGFVQTEVIDQGVGIHEDELPFIFQPLHRSSSRPTAGESSTGLGLAIAKKIIEEHEGSISVTSTLNQGSCFCFTIPL
jgi:signal transduction histidine kinase